MEAIGKVNAYEPVKFGRKEVYIINLSTGVTPFVRFFDGEEYRSLFYRLRKPVLVTVTHAAYRPTRAEFDTLAPEMQKHVLNGGLCLSELAKAKPLPDDPTTPEIKYETLQAWCLTIYGQRLGPVPGEE
jgi:hypothetical protein